MSAVITIAATRACAGSVKVRPMKRAMVATLSLPARESCQNHRAHHHVEHGDDRDRGVARHGRSSDGSPPMLQMLL
jgi:hypothetical protein